MTQEELLTKYKKYSVGQLKLLYNNKNIAQDKLEVIESILLERGAIEKDSENSDSKDSTKVEKVSKTNTKKQSTDKVDKDSKPKTKTTKSAKGADSEKADKSKKEKVPRKKKTNENDPWLFKEGDVVKIQLAKNRKERAGEIIEGKVLKTKEWQGFKEYIVDTEEGKMIKRQNTLAKHN